MSNYIVSPVKNLLEKSIKNRAFTPMDFNYPDFSITAKDHVSLMGELIQRKINVNLSRGDYRSSLLLDGGESFTDLVRGEMLDQLNERQRAVLTKALPADLERDMALDDKNMQNFSSQAVLKGLSEHIKATILEVSIIKNSLPDELNPLEGERKLDGLAASIIYLKFNNPIAYKELETEIESSPFKDVVVDLKKEVDNPSLTTLSILNKFDNKFVQEHFPKQSMRSSHNDDLASKIFKMRKPVEEKRRVFSMS